MDANADPDLLASRDPRVRFAAEDRLRRAGPVGLEALARFVNTQGLSGAQRAPAADLLGSVLREGALEAFRSAVPDPTSPSLWSGAVAIAAEAHPALDLLALDRRRDELVAGARAVVPATGAVAGRVERLTAYLHHDLGFAGDSSPHQDVRNSYLPDVLDRRRGLPVTLAVVWMTIAEALGLEVAGVGLPLHFVARCEGEDGPLFVDAFHGAVLDESGCRLLVASAAGRKVRLPPATFRPLRPGEVLLRMLRNLRALHEQAGHLHMALASVDRTLHLAPLDVQTLRERALLFARLSRPAAAARSISRVLALEPEARDRRPLEALRRRLQCEAAALN